MIRESSAQAAHVFIADDELEMREIVGETLKDSGWQVTEYNPYQPEPELLNKTYHLAILDIIMPGINGFALRRKLLENSPDAQFIMITGFPDDENHEKALACGIYSFLIKPFGRKQIRYAAAGALKKQREFRNRCNESSCREDNDPPSGLIGTSPPIVALKKQIRHISRSMLPVLITGATGTGKEVAAREIHRNSRRVSGPFIAVNCGALSPGLIESELFGHAKGAFTGATRIKHGFFESARGGTLFLDEIGELPLELQCRFLRILDNGEYIRVGETTPRTSDVRIISATNRNLCELTRQGAFREDLLYRLRGCMLNIAPLCERKEDIPLLVRQYLSAEYTLTDKAIAALKMHSWPGNVRELIMVTASLESMYPASAISDKAIHEILHLYQQPESVLNLQPYHQAKQRLLYKFDHEYFSTLMRHNKGNLSRTAAEAQLDRKHLREKLRQLGIYPNA